MRRDDRGKKAVSHAAVGREATDLLDAIQETLYAKAKRFREENTRRVDSYDEFKAVLAEQGGFVEAHWNGSPEVEARIKEETKATIRIIPMEGDPEPGKCMVTGEPSPQRVVFAHAY